VQIGGGHFGFPVIGFSGHDREQRGRREPKTPHRKRELLPLAGIVSAALPAQGAQTTQCRLSRGRFPPVIRWRC
jgi:hypothetical protein